MLVALAVLHDDPANRFSRLLLAAGLAFSLTTLAVSDESIPYSLGRVSVWLVIPILQVPAADLPSGRVTEPRDTVAAGHGGGGGSRSSTCRRRCSSDRYPSLVAMEQLHERLPGERLRAPRTSTSVSCGRSARC
jgi:hypothetical protein